jgi:hypothetical protein
MTEDLLKDGYDYEDYTENFIPETVPCCKTRNDEEAPSCGCQPQGIPIKK